MATSTTSEFNYDVFLSFRGTDTRKTFTDHLYKALKNAGVETFRDDNEIERGKSVRSELQRAIRHSKMSIVVFSNDYASSRACLEEVELILQQSKKSEHAILPIFYHVEPAKLKKQARDLAAKEIKKERNTAAALEEVASIAGMPLKDQHESVFIEEIVEMVARKLVPKVLTLGHHIIGMDSRRVKKIDVWLKDEETDVGILVICGMGGLGKTTTSKFLFNSNYERFDGSSFLGNIREASNPDGLVRLQRQLLADILPKPEKKIYTIDDGLRRIQYVLKNKRVLLVLDDVDEVDQLDAILGIRNWFTLGSKIIITTRREDLLKAHEKYIVHKIENLNDDESLELFSLHAFGQRRPVSDFTEHSERFVSHCQGLPLALEVLGSSLHRKSLDVWESALKKLEAIPETKILEKLKISYDSLKTKHDRNLFLDIACFFVGKDKNDTVEILDACDYYTAVGIENLVDRNLLSVGENSKLGMHQLLQDMGRQVACQESDCPEEQTRLWRCQESLNVLREKIGSANVEGLILDMRMLKQNNFSTTNIPSRPRFFWSPVYQAWTNPAEEFLETDAFKGMRNLRILMLSYVKLYGTYEIFPKKLRWLYWRGFHLKSWPNEFPLENIVSLDLRNSNLRQVWKDTKVLGSLKILNLSHSSELVKTPNFSTIPNLEKLILKDCPRLIEVDESIVTLERLIILNLEDCKNLRKLVRNISMVRSLEQLIISGCSNLVGAAEELEKMKYLKVLRTDRMLVNQVFSKAYYTEVAPRYAFSILPWVAKPIKNPELSWVSLPRSLVTLTLKNSNLTDDAFPKDFGTLPMLENLNLAGNPICSLPADFIKNLGRLQCLDLSACQRLEQIHWPSMKVEYLVVRHCHSLQRFTLEPSFARPKTIRGGGCINLNYVERGFKIEPIEKVDPVVLENIGFFYFETNKTVEVIIVNTIVRSKKKLPIQIMYEDGLFSTYFPGREVPHYFTNKSSRSTISLTLPSSTSFPQVCGLNMCLVYTLPVDSEDWFYPSISVEISNKKKSGFHCGYMPWCYGIHPDHPDGWLIWLSHFYREEWLNLFEEGDEVEVCFTMNVAGGKIKECGVQLLYFGEGGAVQYEKTLLSLWDSKMDFRHRQISAKKKKKKKKRD